MRHQVVTPYYPHRVWNHNSHAELRVLFLQTAIQACLPFPRQVAFLIEVRGRQVRRHGDIFENRKIAEREDQGFSGVS